MATSTLKKQIYTATITLVSIALALLGELMPQELKDKITQSVATVGLSFIHAWVFAIVFMVVVLLVLTWRGNPANPEPKPPVHRQVTQTGDKAAYVEQNNGGIHIS